MKSITLHTISIHLELSILAIRFSKFSHKTSQKLHDFSILWEKIFQVDNAMIRSSPLLHTANQKETKVFQGQYRNRLLLCNKKLNDLQQKSNLFAGITFRCCYTLEFAFNKYVDNIPLRKRNYEVNPEGENSAFIFTVCVKSVSCYHFKLACVILHMAVKEFFRNPLLKWKNRPFKFGKSVSTNLKIGAVYC